MPNTHFKIREKIFFLVAVPLLFEFLFVGWLWILIQQAEQEFDRLQASKDMLTQIQRTKSSIAQAIAIAAVARTNDSSGVQALKELRATLTQARINLGQHEHKRPEVAPKLKNFEELLDRGIAFSSKAEAVFDDPKITAAKRGKYLRPELYALLQDVKPAVDELLHYELNVQHTTPTLLALAQFRVFAVLTGGLILSAFLSLALALFFSKDIARRIAAISQNARLLVYGVPLLRTDSQCDEIGQLDATLHESSQRLLDFRRKESVYAENASAVACSLDKGGAIVFVSRAAIRLWWIAPDDLIGRSIFEIVPVTQHDFLSTALQRAMAGEQQSFELNVIRPDGAQVDTLWSIRFSAEKELFFCLAHDISEQAQLDRVKKQFLSMVSHDLKTPIASIGGSLTLLQEGARGQLSSAALDKIQSSCDKLGAIQALLEQLLDLEKLDSSKNNSQTECASVVDIYSRCLESVADLKSKKRITLHGPDYDANVVVDTQRIEQATLALLRLLIDNTPAGGDIKISIATQSPDVVIRLCTPVASTLGDVSDHVEAELASTILQGQDCEMGIDGEGIWVRMPAFVSEVEE